MMAIYYSNSKKAFYDTNVISYPILPEDIIEITSEQHKSFLVAMNHEDMELTLQSGNVLTLVPRESAYRWTWDMVRKKRNLLLSDSDFTQTSDYKKNKEAWAEYRQLLRDLPQDYDDPNDIIWPEKPN